ncbi:hypothetical protein JIN84_08490 [Luteolibacter yonseiensis]|uniref:Uncharacterized protein n=1 Tax=Luteolibacter yonseiensis TaxID=1144680 RepID=A0A934R289_9BACT|nr:hypothetical protein [Luteolibacter yonseiensis]MBK1815651.1 hypothetical protein [Luteolibacter yonseiensis]
MSAAPSEPEKYSIDEMMNRLKQSSAGNPEEGELVTRADGSQAVRVRKRKRRSSQPHKKDAERIRRARAVQIAAALILVLLAALTIGVGIIYANSGPFRNSLVTKIGESTGAKAELHQFRMNPKTANANYLILEWPQGSLLKTMNFRGLNAEIFPSSFLGKSMTGEEVTAIESKIALQYPQPGQPRRAGPAAGSSLPVNFGRYRTRLMDVTLGSGPSTISLSKAEGSYTASNIKGRPQLSVSKGELGIPNWPKLRLDRALVEFRGEEADIISFRMLHEKDNRGSFQLSGTLSPYKPEQVASLAATLELFPLSGLIGPALGGLIEGEVDTEPADTSNFLSFQPTANSLAKLDVTVAASPGSAIRMHGFPFLNAISEALGDDKWFVSPVFESHSQVHLIREGGAVTLRDVRLESKSRMAMKGEISLTTKNTLSGTLEVGLSETILLASRHQRLISMFGPATEGFCWITLQLGGQANAPTDDFKALFDAAKTGAGPSAPAGTPASTFEELTRPK